MISFIKLKEGELIGDSLLQIYLIVKIWGETL